LGVGEGRTVSVREAVMGMIVLSANDAAVAVAEKLGGTEEKFADMMTLKARQLGMTNTVFKNAAGLPDPDQVTSARDMSRLGMALMRYFPDEFKLFSTTSFEFRGIKLRGHNYVMNRYDGVDGIKTGFTTASGYNVVTSAQRGTTRVVGVVMGGETAEIRDRDMSAMLDKYLPQPSNDHTAATTK
jgi:D-alanyl-D-alanine carboxypeptidase (penicillin-binding protein 5/6)